MMLSMRRWYLLTPLLLVLAGFFLWWNRPAQIVKRKSSALLETLSLEADHGRIGRGLRSNDLRAFLAPQVELQSPVGAATGSFSRSELESGFNWYCQRVVSSEFKIQTGPLVAVEGDSAESTMEVQINASIPGYTLPPGAYAVTLNWILSPDGWVLTRAEWSPH